MFKKKKGESGIGTLILFIAMILVAAIAAGVLIQTSMNLQSKALSTGTKAKSQVSTAAAISAIWAEDGSSGSVNKTYLSIKLVPGSDAIKFTDTLIELILDNTSRQYTSGSESSTVATSTSYNYYYEINGTNHKTGYLVPGDLAKIGFTSPRAVTEDEDYRITVSPKTGSITQVYGSTPDIMTQTKIYLYP